MINWKVRIRNKLFWLSVIPAVFLVVQMALAIFGISVDFAELQGKILALVDAVFALLAVLGVTVDMTTKGIADSARAMYYEVPYDSDANKEDGENNG